MNRMNDFASVTLCRPRSIPTECFFSEYGRQSKCFDSWVPTGSCSPSQGLVFLCACEVRNCSYMLDYKKGQKLEAVLPSRSARFTEDSDAFFTSRVCSGRERAVSAALSHVE